MMNITDVARLRNLTEEAENTTAAILRVIYEVWGDDGDRGTAARYSSFVGLEGDTVMCSGDEFGRYGYHEKHSISFPVYWLTFDLDHIRALELSKKAEEDAKNARAAAKMLETREENERKDYERLKKKFESYCDTLSQS